MMIFYATTVSVDFETQLQHVLRQDNDTGGVSQCTAAHLYLFHCMTIRITPYHSRRKLCSWRITEGEKEYALREVHRSPALFLTPKLHALSLFPSNTILVLVLLRHLPIRVQAGS